MGRKIGIYVYHCGSNYRQRFRRSAGRCICKSFKISSGSSGIQLYVSGTGKEMIKKDIIKLGVDRVSMASSSHQIHEPTFRRAVSAAGLGPYLFDMANIQEHDSWVTEDKSRATEKFAA